MILCLDVGNTTIHAGVYSTSTPGGSFSPPGGPGPKLLAQFRRTSEFRASSDEIGLFMLSALRENGVAPEKISRIAICSVVPDAVYSIRGACQKYFQQVPFLLQAGVKTGLKIRYRNPLEVGSDRIANSIAAVERFPNRDLIIVDFGTATTFCAIGRDKEYLGGVIIAGIRISMEALETKTAKLPSVEILPVKNALGRSTVESIQSGLYFGQVGTVKEIRDRITAECFSPHGAQSEKPVTIATGGFAGLFETEELFDHVIPDLVLRGLYLATEMNKDEI